MRMAKQNDENRASDSSPDSHGEGRGGLRNWTREEDQLIRKWYPKKGSPYLETLLDRTRSAIQARAEKLGVPGTIRPWTNKEEVFLKHNYGKRTATEIAKRLGRSEQSVRGKLHIMGYTGPASRKWTAGELEYLRENYGKFSTKKMARELDRTIDAVEIKAGRIGLSRKTHVLTDKEKEWIIRNLGTISYLNMAKRFGVSPQLVQNIAHEHGYHPKPNMRPWTEQDIEYLRRHYGIMSRKQLAEALGRTVNTVQDRACKLGLTRQHTPSKRWSKKEEEFLRQQVGRMTKEELARKLGRSYNSVAGKIQMMGLSGSRSAGGRGGKGKVWSGEEEDLLRQKYATESIEELARLLGRSVNSIRGKIRMMGLHNSSGETKGE